MKRIYKAPLANVLPDTELRARITHPSFTGRLLRRNDLRARIADIDSKPDDSLELRRSRHEAQDAAKRIDHELNDIKNQHAALVANMFPEPLEHDIHVEGGELVGHFPSGSAQWLKSRQPSVGGSDVGAIMKADPVWGVSNYYKVRDAHLEKEPENQDHNDAAGRGDTWEPALIALATEILGEQVFTNKDTIRKGLRHANLDGFTVDDSGEVKDIIECKTSSFPDEWTDNSIPVGYALQTEHYMDFYGVDHAYLIVNVDDSMLYIYSINVDDEVEPSPEASKILEKEIGLYTAGGYNYWNVRGYVEKVVDDWNFERLHPKRPRGRLVFSKAWRDPWKKALEQGMVFLDIETTTFSPKTGHIIEIGAVRDDGAEFSEFFGVPDDHAAWNGTGASDVHRITLDMVDGLPVLLYSDEWIEKLKEFVGNRVVVAHNDGFEKRWLDFLGTHFDYADTMKAFSVFAPKDTADNTMKSLTEAAGMEYVDAHRAINDTRMMKEAYERFLDEKVRSSL